MRFDPTTLLLLTTLAMMSACGLGDRTRVEEPAAAAWPTQEDTLDFWDHLESQPVTTNDDALHGLLLFAGHTPEAATWDERLAAARQRGWIAADRTPIPNESAEMGLISVCVCRILDLQGGLSMQVFGPTPRYCTRELVHTGLLPGITEHEALTGAEFIALLSAMEQRQLMDQAWAARTAQADNRPDAIGTTASDASPGESDAERDQEGGTP